MSFNKSICINQYDKTVPPIFTQWARAKNLPAELVKQGKKLSLLQQEPKIKQWKTTFRLNATIYNELLDNFEICYK